MDGEDVNETDLLLNSTHQNNFSSYATYSYVMNTLYYTSLLPIMLLGNVLSIVVIVCIIHHQHSRRSIVDVLLGSLATVDLFSVVTVHLISLVYIARPDLQMRKHTAVLQAFSSSLYLKLQFLIQVCISLDRYLALVRPLQYNARRSSVRGIACVLGVIFVLTVISSIVLLTTCNQRVKSLLTWSLSLLAWDLTCISHIIIAISTTIVYLIGFIIFVHCNTHLVRILWQYHSQREKMDEINQVVTVLEKKVTEHLQLSQILHQNHSNKRVSNASSIRPHKPLSRSGIVGAEELHVAYDIKPESSPNSWSKNISDSNRSLQTPCENHTYTNGQSNETKHLINGRNITINIEEPSSNLDLGTPDSTDSKCHLMDVYPKVSSRQVSINKTDEQEASEGDGLQFNTRPKTPDTLNIQRDAYKRSVSFTEVPACTLPVGNETFHGKDLPPMTQFTGYVQKILKKLSKKTERQRREVLLARMVAVCSTLFLATWIPYTITLVLSLSGKEMHPLLTDVSVRLMFANAALNPIFYGLCRSNYRKGYKYVTLYILHYICCGCIERPTDDLIFYESKTKKVRRHLAAADMNIHMQARRQRRKAITGHTLQILQQTLQIRRATSHIDKASPVSEAVGDFRPSSRLQCLFQQCLELDTSDTSSSSSVDYDHLADLVNDDLYENLQRIWSLYDINNEVTQLHAEVDSDNEESVLNINYDDIVTNEQVLDEHFYGISMQDDSSTQNIALAFQNTSV